MFSAKRRYIDYRIQKPCGHVVHVPTTLNEFGIAERAGEAAPSARTSPEFVPANCQACEHYHGHCMAENAIADVATALLT